MARNKVYPLPVLVYQDAQIELLRHYAWYPMQSNLGAIVAMLEGGSGGDRPEFYGSRGFEKVRRHNAVNKALRACGARVSQTMKLVYGDQPEPCWAQHLGRLSNLLPESQIAHNAHTNSETTADYFLWLVRLASKLERNTATREDRSTKEAIKLELETRVLDALATYKEAR